jgi:hypothetical protein
MLTYGLPVVYMTNINLDFRIYKRVIKYYIFIVYFIT